MNDFSDSIDCMGQMKSLIDAMFKEHSKGPFKKQLYIYIVFLISMVFSIVLWEHDIHWSLFSALIGLVMLIILHWKYELPQRNEAFKSSSSYKQGW